jgi:hypothetical protein
MSCPELISEQMPCPEISEQTKSSFAVISYFQQWLFCIWLCFKAVEREEYK